MRDLCQKFPVGVRPARIFETPKEARETFPTSRRNSAGNRDVIGETESEEAPKALDMRWARLAVDIVEKAFCDARLGSDVSDSDETDTDDFLYTFGDLGLDTDPWGVAAAMLVLRSASLWSPDLPLFEMRLHVP